MQNFLVVFLLIALLSSCTAAKKESDKNAAPPQLIDVEAGTTIGVGEKISDLTQAHNEAVPVGTNDEYVLKHIVKDVGGRGAGVQVSFKTAADVVQPQSVEVIFSPPGEQEPESKQTTANALFEPVSPGLWKATVSDNTYGNGWTLYINTACKALKEGAGTSEIEVGPAGGAASSAVHFQDSHNVLGQ